MRQIDPILFVQHIHNIRSIVQRNNIDITNNVSFKRDIIQELKITEIETPSNIEEYDRIINKLIDKLEGSTMDEDFMINQIRNISVIEDNFDVSNQILNEIGENLIKTGDYINPGIGGDPSNPEHGNLSALLQFGPNKFTDPPTDIVNTSNFIKKEDLIEKRVFNIPTDSERSPSKFTVNEKEYECTPFTQELLRFEEFGRTNFKQAHELKHFNPNTLKVPQPDTDGYPNEKELNKFMMDVNSTNLGFEPMIEANVTNPNPWASKIREDINPPEFVEGVAEGRVHGLAGRHHSWTDDTEPHVMCVTCQTGAIENKGTRDSQQMHKYEYGEFGKKGLYYMKGTTNGIKPMFHFGLPVQKKESLWTFDGTFPMKINIAKYSEAHIMRHWNFLPIKPDNNRGFGLHTISTHEHNSNTYSSSDGFASSYFFPGQYYDYYYPMHLTGYSTQNTKALDPKAAIPMDWKRDSEGNIIMKNGKKVANENKLIPGDWKETMSTHWAHDHMLDYTSHNVYKGNTIMINYYSAIDRGNEEIDDGVNLRFASGTELSWGNRDYDVNLAIMDKAWDKEGQLWFNPFNTNGFLGDRMLVNLCLEPFFNVRRRRYRFRILNAGVSRFIKLALVVKYEDDHGRFKGPIGSGISYDPVPLWMIANDGNIMMHAVKFNGKKGTERGILPVQAIAERFDVIIDFGRRDDFGRYDFKVGDKLYFVNVLEHLNGKKPNKKIALADILNGTYGNDIENDKGDPCVMKFMEFRVNQYDGDDKSVDPSKYEVGKRQMIPLEPITEDEMRNAVQRHFKFVNKNGTTDEWAISVDNGENLHADMRRISAAPQPNSLELWTFSNGSTSWAHNVHHHFVESKIITRDNALPPLFEQMSRKDVIRIGGSDDSSESVLLALKFKDVKNGYYMTHCHNTVHEDHAMLLRWDIQDKSCVKCLPSPYPTWQGVKFLETKSLPTFRHGMAKDNDEYRNPDHIIKNLKNLNKTLPDHIMGSYFVNGLGNQMEFARDDDQDI
jgi:FtsP/CotA-like multicopper oxidase with cupredoxin domain